MIDENKLQRVRRYLRQPFTDPGYSFQDRFNTTNDTQEFTVWLGDAVTHRIRISREMFDDHGEGEILQLFDTWNLRRHLQTAGGSWIVITNNGISRS